MPDGLGRTTENEFAEVVLRILVGQPNGGAAFSTIIAAIPHHMNLTPADLAGSETRPNEAVWEQRVRNIKSHKNAEGNYINSGYLMEIEGGLALTNAGRQRVT